MTEFSKIIRQRREKVLVRQGYLSLLFRVLIIALIVYLVLTKVFMATQAKGQGMFPAVKDGDLAIAYRLQDKYQKNDVIIYEYDGEIYIGRILAKDSDFVDISENGSLSVNGTVQSGEIFYPTYAKDGEDYPRRIPENSFYVLGDYRTNTQDSRDFGTIPKDDVKGKVITIFRRRGL